MKSCLKNGNFSDLFINKADAMISELSSSETYDFVNSYLTSFQQKVYLNNARWVGYNSESAITSFNSFTNQILEFYTKRDSYYSDYLQNFIDNI